MSVRTALLVGLTACSSGGGDGRCGPGRATVLTVVDGDTIELAGGETVRYLMVDTPEISEDDCFAFEARDFNADLVAGREVTLTYDIECADFFGRLLAYVSVDGREVNSLLVERGYACVLSIPPNGQDREAEFVDLEMRAEAEGRGMWGACAVVSCGE
jgi:micrococcal nuclease